MPRSVRRRPALGVPDRGDGIEILSDLDPDGRGLQHSGLLAAQEMVEELGLHLQTGRRVIGARADGYRRTPEEAHDP